MIRFLAVALILALAGCSLFNDAKPKSNFTIMRAGLDKTGKLVPADTLGVPNEWAQDSILLDMEDVFQPSASKEILAKRTIHFSRITDPSVAGQVAIARAQATAAVTTSTVHEAATLGTAALTSGASGAVDALTRYLEGS